MNRRHWSTVAGLVTGYALVAAALVTAAAVPLAVAWWLL